MQDSLKHYSIAGALAVFCGFVFVILGGVWSTSHSYAEPLDNVVDEMTWSRGSANAIVGAYGLELIDKATENQFDPSVFSVNEVAAIGLALTNTGADLRFVTQGVEYLSFACEQKQARACRNLAFHIEREEKRPDEALPIYHQACALGNDLGCLDAYGLPFKLAKRRGGGAELTAFADEASKVLADLCTEGMNAACYSMDDLHTYLGQTDRRIEVLSALCKRDEYNACWRLADIHWQADNFAEGLELLEPFCETSRTGACNRLGYFQWRLSDFKGVEKNLAPACDAGDAEACYLYARVLTEGDNPNGSPEVGNQLLKRTCRAGHFVACSSYAYNLENANGIDQDTELSLQYAKVACEHGVPKACQIWALNLTNSHNLTTSEGLTGSSEVFQILDQIVDLHAYACKNNLFKSCGWAVEYLEMGAQLSYPNETAASLLAHSCANGVVPDYLVILKTKVDECPSQ